MFPQSLHVFDVYWGGTDIKGSDTRFAAFVIASLNSDREARQRCARALSLRLLSLSLTSANTARLISSKTISCL